MTLERYIQRYGKFPHAVESEILLAWNRAQPGLEPMDRLLFPKPLRVSIRTDRHTVANGLWAPYGTLWMAPGCFGRVEWRPTHAVAMGAVVHEAAHPAQWNKLGPVSWMWNLAWASLLQVTGRTWHSAGFEQQAIRIGAAARDAINADNAWKHRLQTEFKQVLERDDYTN